MSAAPPWQMRHEDQSRLPGIDNLWGFTEAYWSIHTGSRWTKWLYASKQVLKLDRMRPMWSHANTDILTIYLKSIQHYWGQFYKSKNTFFSIEDVCWCLVSIQGLNSARLRLILSTVIGIIVFQNLVLFRAQLNSNAKYVAELGLTSKLFLE